jgi:tetratricopeptide (TPR) repeat protein
MILLCGTYIWVGQKALVQAGIAKAEGNKLYAVGNYEEALQSYARALESAPDHPSSSETRAQCYSNRAICQIQLVQPTLPFRSNLPTFVSIGCTLLFIQDYYVCFRRRSLEVACLIKGVLNCAELLRKQESTLVVRIMVEL